ncbi:MAG: GNAT family N-acetyltransferase [Paracoccaceae bacterium]
MLGVRRKIRIFTERLVLRPPQNKDFAQWTAQRRDSIEFLARWEPTWAADHLTRKSFSGRVSFAKRSISDGSAVPLFLVRRSDEALLGAITLDNIRRGPAQAGTIGYWVGETFARQGFMRESLVALADFAFTQLDLSRLESACLPENAASRGVLEKCGFKYEGVAQSYLQIDGRWRNHVLYANLRSDRRGKTDVG